MSFLHPTATDDERNVCCPLVGFTLSEIAMVTQHFTVVACDHDDPESACFFTSSFEILDQ